MANSYLTWQNSTATNSTKFTMSAWVKRGNLNSSSYSCIMSCRQTSSTNAMGLWFGSDRVYFNFGTGASTSQTGFDTSAYVRDTNGWYHIVVAGDASQSGTDKLKVWINNTQQTSFVTDNRSSFATLEYDFGNTSYPIQVGRKHDDTFFWDGYMSHVAFVDGTALTPSSFGETDSTSGIWKFKSPSSISWGNNGFHLKFENSGAMGTDSSGNSNTFTVNGNLKQALDTPSNVHATLNPLISKGSDSNQTQVLSNGNLSVTGNQASWCHSRGTFGASSGKWYWEVKLNGSSMGYLNIGVSNASVNMHGGTVQSVSGNTSIYGDGQKNINGTITGSQSPTFSAGDICGVALDMDNNQVSFYKNGTILSWATDLAISGGTDDVWLPASAVYNTSQNLDFNFGNGFFGTTAITSAGSNGNGSLFEYDVPSGYYALNTKNINTYG